MLKKSTRDDDTNFWLSYADLMAGLLFVFILLIGAIVIKSIILKSNLDSKESSLESSLQVLLLRDAEVQRLKELLAQKDEELKEIVELSSREIESLSSALLSQTVKIDDLNSKIILMQNLLDEANSSQALQNKRLQDYENQVLILSNELSSRESVIKLRDKELLKMLLLLEQKETKYDALIEKLQEQKAKIKSIAGVKIKVIALLKESLGSRVEVDKKSGSLRLSSNILFDRGSYLLKESSKEELENIFINYVGALTSDSSIRSQLDKIIIEGHTDSDGGYIYNLHLSQQRAFAVMNHLLTLDFTQKNNLKPLLIASGRSDQDTIKNSQGIEDKNLSRRIEIKFTLKNDDAMNQIGKILEYE